MSVDCSKPSNHYGDIPTYGAGHETFVLSTDQSRPHIQEVPRAALCSTLELAADAWYCVSRSHIQQYDLSGKCLRSLCHVCYTIRQLYGLPCCDHRLEDSSLDCFLSLVDHRLP